MSQANGSIIKIQVFAKVNLALRILGRLEGGYHSLETIFQNISLSDKLTIRETPGRIIVHCGDPAVPEGEENTAYRAAELCLQRLGIRDRGVEIRIEKGIPTRAGLGGGSASRQHPATGDRAEQEEVARAQGLQRHVEMALEPEPADQVDPRERGRHPGTDNGGRERRVRRFPHGPRCLGSSLRWGGSSSP